MFDPSLADLVIFAPSEPVVDHYITQTKSDWTKGKYWLGGQITLFPDDKITDAIINKVQNMFDDSDSYMCNSFEMASVLRAQNQLSQIKNLVKRYREEAKRRLTEDLNKTKLNSDVNGVIVSMCG